MKKVLFSLVALMAVMTVQAQSVCGSWQSMQPEVNNGNNGTYSTFTDTYTFNEDGTFASAADITYSTKPSQTKEREVALVANVKGTYTQEGNKLVLKVDFNTLTLELISISENGKVINAPELKAGFNDVFNNDETKTKAAKGFKNDTYTVKLDANGSMLELTDAKGNTEKLIRIVTIKH
ncbi:MAG: hypothetical protein IKW97_06580 [Muribaculaceae bacterium]|nr:hypothetical protein [Muribaculaceae bacterium]